MAMQRVIVDWGTSTFRANLVEPDGAIRARIETQDGIQSIAKDRFPDVLDHALTSWRSAYGSLSIYAAGMIGSRNGWIEMPYVPTPADARSLAARVKRVTLPSGDVITFIPGLTEMTAQPFPDVMRGEETQLVGLGLDADRTVVLPGTHAKWARIENGRIARFKTFMTGEMFATMSKHSFIAKVATAPASPDWTAFARGVAYVRDDLQSGGLLGRLFSVRTGWLAGGLDPAQMTDFLSGIIVGSEFREAQDLGWFTPGDTITIVGDDDLVDVYCRAAEAFELTTTKGHKDAAVRGCLAIAALTETIDET
jgi:2-dehydro-3-deoxygalactonokinase